MSAGMANDERETVKIKVGFLDLVQPKTHSIDPGQALETRLVQGPERHQEVPGKDLSGTQLLRRLSG